MRAGAVRGWRADADLDARFHYDRRERIAIDLDVLHASVPAIEAHVRDRAAPLLEQGGYIPLADGRVRATVPFASYCAYRRMLEALAGGGAA